MFGTRSKLRGGSAAFAWLPAVLLLASGFCTAGEVPSASQSSAVDPLLKGFESPPESARPRVWWHWMNGNVTDAGIRKDLAWMHRVGLGGVDVIDASLFTPHLVKPPLIYMTPQWKAAFRYAAQLATRYGLQLSVDSSPGWSETGGPWVTPDEAMKKLVWSATVVTGGKPFEGALALPPAQTGPFQDAAGGGGFSGPSPFAHLKFYRDSLVIAYRAPILDPHPTVGASSTGPLDAKALVQLSDGHLGDGVALGAPKGVAWVRLSYAAPVRLQGVTLAASSQGLGPVAAVVYVSTDGSRWRAVAHLQPLEAGLDETFPEQTVSFAPVTARYVRLVLRAVKATRMFTPPFMVNAPGAVPLSAMLGAYLKHVNVPPAFELHELAMHARATVNQFEAKADYRIVPDFYAIASLAEAAPGTAIDPKSVVNLTGRMKPDGQLDWTPPPGQWVILRLGYSLEGTTNHPAPPSETGLEVDKLSAADVKSYMGHYLELYRAITGPFGPNSVNAFTTDSTEVGMQNWTPTLIADFERLRGYDPIPWLSALTGAVVGSPAQSDRFLWDYRRTIDQLLATNHYRVIQQVAHAQGLVTYGEALEDHRPTFGDDMEMRQYTDIPMGAMWMYPAGGKPFPTYVADIRGAASVAHIYGRRNVGAESLDSVDQPWAYAPRELKPMIDEDFLLGVNRVVIHESAEQPLETPPGISLGFFGQMFNRLDTWADDARPWVRYIARCSYLLQQGHYVADIAYFYGQGTPITSVFGDRRIDVPHGYGFDFVDSDVLRDKLSVEDGRLITASGMSYRVLYLGGSSRWMTFDVLKRIDTLVRDGATVVGRRPTGSPSLRDDPQQFRALAQALFGPAGDTAVRHVGRGTVFPAGSLPRALKTLGLAPDFQYTESTSGTQLRAIHRRLAQRDLYFVSNRTGRSERVTASFRVSSGTPELWDAVTGRIQPVDYRIVGGRTQIPLRLASYGSVFVMFGPHLADAPAGMHPAAHTLLTLAGPWQVAFQPNRGAPADLLMPHLDSWTTSAAPGVKYFSGTATYTKSFQLAPRDDGAHLVLDLGEVRELARVTVNRRPVGIVWTPPFRLDVTEYVHPGTNTLSIAVTNLWVNRLIGDQQPGVTRKYTFTTLPTYESNAPLRPSGLLGPVRLLRVSAPADPHTGG